MAKHTLGSVTLQILVSADTCLHVVETKPHAKHNAKALSGTSLKHCAPSPSLPPGLTPPAMLSDRPFLWIDPPTNLVHTAAAQARQDHLFLKPYFFLS